MSMNVLLAALLLQAADPPNVVFILADDLGISDLSCYGRKDQPTPNLDRLAAAGLRFTNAFCAQPICSPSRAALMTGKTPTRTGITTFIPGRPDAPSQLLLHPAIRPQLPLEEPTVAERLKAAGYATGYVGKWHLGGKGFLPPDQGFDRYVAPPANTAPTAVEGGKGESAIAAAAEAFLEEHKDRRFLLFVSHNNPHVPLAEAPDRIERHAGAFHPLYAATIASLDASVGRLLDRLDALGLAEKTLVVFTSDNGGLHVQEATKAPATHNAPFRAGKGFCYDGGLRIPLLVRWTGTVGPGVVDAPVVHMDWPVTLADLAGTRMEGPVDGVSLAPLLRRGEAPAPRPLFWHFPHYTNQGGRPAGAVLDGGWKLVEHYEDGRLELFRPSDDPGETADLSAKEPARVAALRGRLEGWRRAVGAAPNAANPAFNPSLWAKVYGEADVAALAPAATALEMAPAQERWRAEMNAMTKGGEAGRGAVILHARDATVTGTKLRYEPEPQKDTLGFWTQKDDTASWTFEAPSSGTYEVEILQGAGRGGAEVEVAVGTSSLRFTVEATGHFQRFVPRRIGTVTLEKGRHVLTLRPLTKPGPAVMDVRRVTLR